MNHSPGELGKALDVGNACDLDFADALDFLEHDPQTEIIVLHMEGIRGGRRFLETAARVARSKPIIVLKTGRSIAGARAALSHTGSLVGEDAVVDAAFTRAGLIRVRTMMEMRAVCQAFLHFRTMAGPSLAVITATGACGIMTADACEDYGLELAPFPEGIRSGLENAHIAWHKLNNPVDIWPLGMVTGSFTNVFKNAARGLLQDDRVHALLGIVPALSSPLHADLDLAAMMREIQAANPEHKPIALWLYADGVAEKARTLANEPGVACFGSIDEAVMGLAALNRYRRFVEQALSKPAAAVASAPQTGSLQQWSPNRVCWWGKPPWSCSEIIKFQGFRANWRLMPPPPLPLRPVWLTRWSSRLSPRSGCTNPIWVGCGSTSATVMSWCWPSMNCWIVFAGRHHPENCRGFWYRNRFGGLRSSWGSSATPSWGR